MPDTVRTLAALQALLADNVAGDIGAQDLRDFLLSRSCAAQMSGALQVIGDSSVTVVDFNAEIFDTDGSIVDLAANDLTVPVDGVYEIFAQGDWDGSSASGVRFMGIYKNAAIVARYETNGSNLHRNGTALAALDQASAGDTYDMRVFQDTGGNYNFSGVNTPIRFGLRLVA